MEQITSPQNSKIKLVNRLRGKRAREQEGRFLIENLRDLQRALRQGFVIDFALVCPQIAGGSGDTGELGGRALSDNATDPQTTQLPGKPQRIRRGHAQQCRALPARSCRQNRL